MMKAQILGIVVISALTISMVITGVSAVVQAVTSDNGISEGYLTTPESSDPNFSNNNKALMGTFRFVCPFH